MDFESYLRQSLYFQGLPVYQNDIPYIHRTLYTMNQAEAALKAFPYLKKELPILIVDKGLMKG